MAESDDTTMTGMAPLEARSAEVARILKLLANQSRLLIVCRLAAAGELSVAGLAETARLSQSAASQHLAKLREEGLVRFRRDGQTIFYSIADRQTERLLSSLKDIYCPEIQL